MKSKNNSFHENGPNFLKQVPQKISASTIWDRVLQLFSKQYFHCSFFTIFPGNTFQDTKKRPMTSPFRFTCHRFPYLWNSIFTKSFENLINKYFHSTKPLPENHRPLKNTSDSVPLFLKSFFQHLKTMTHCLFLLGDFDNRVGGDLVVPKNPVRSTRPSYDRDVRKNKMTVALVQSRGGEEKKKKKKKARPRENKGEGFAGERVVTGKSRDVAGSF